MRRQLTPAQVSNILPILDIGIEGGIVEGAQVAKRSGPRLGDARVQNHRSARHGPEQMLEEGVELFDGKFVVVVVLLGGGGGNLLEPLRERDGRLEIQLRAKELHQLAPRLPRRVLQVQRDGQRLGRQGDLGDDGRGVLGQGTEALGRLEQHRDLLVGVPHTRPPGAGDLAAADRGDLEPAGVSESLRRSLHHLFAHELAVGVADPARRLLGGHGGLGDPQYRRRPPELVVVRSSSISSSSSSIQPDLGHCGDGRDKDQPAALCPSGGAVYGGGSGRKLQQAPEELELVPERAQRHEVVHRPGGVDDVRDALLHGGVGRGRQAQPVGGGIDLERGHLGPLLLGDLQPSRLEDLAVERWASFFSSVAAGSRGRGRHRAGSLVLADDADDVPDLRSPGEVRDAENDGLFGVAVAAAGRFLLLLLLLLLLRAAGPAAEAVPIREFLHLLDDRVAGRRVGKGKRLGGVCLFSARPALENRGRHLAHRRVAVYELGRDHLGHVHFHVPGPGPGPGIETETETLRLGRRGHEDPPQLESLQGVDAQVEEAVVDGPRRHVHLGPEPSPQVLVDEGPDALLEVVEVEGPDGAHLGGGGGVGRSRQPLVDGPDLLVEQGVRLPAGDGSLVGPRDDLVLVGLRDDDDDGVRRGDARGAVHPLAGGRDDGPDDVPAERLHVPGPEQPLRLPRLDDDAEVELILAERHGRLDPRRLAQHRLEDQRVGLLPRRQHDDVVVAPDGGQVGDALVTIHPLVPDELVGDLDALVVVFVVAKGEHGEPEPPLASVLAPGRRLRRRRFQLGQGELDVVPEPEVLPVIRRAAPFGPFPELGRKDERQVAGLGGAVEVEEPHAAGRQPVADSGPQRGAAGSHEVHVGQGPDAPVVGEVADGVEEEGHRHHGPGARPLDEVDDGRGVRDAVARRVQRRLARGQGEARGDEAEAVEEGQGREVEALRLLLRVEAVAAEGEEQLAVVEGDGLREPRRAGGVEEQDDAVPVLGALKGRPGLYGGGGGVGVWLVKGVVSVGDMPLDARAASAGFAGSLRRWDTMKEAAEVALIKALMAAGGRRGEMTRA
ncbi:hypothetical protein CTA1_8557 [Colletotrichum tanaceti]|uniref:Uncharacterized protein n=1 Tax=Colletotrichum tanaceti TaxID=1306861 RepID=A0A4V6DJW4_9PEZI|nr:hypothetical protein CTA1_8557 [Colletotrichum tanaceti]